jgi:excisionase family DNA binding protein
VPIQIEGQTIYSLTELEKTLSVSKKTLRTYIREGKLKARKVGREQFVTEKSLVDFLEARG